MFKNRYQARRVADSDGRGCFICHKPTATVLANEIPSADFFYVCPNHLSDPGFAKLDPQIEEQEKEQEKIDAEKRRLKAEWLAKQERERETAANGTSGNDEGNDNDDRKESLAEKEWHDDSQMLSLGSNKQAAPSRSSLPKIYELNRNIYNLRIMTKRRQAQERRTYELLADPASFPKVPTNKID